LRSVIGWIIFDHDPTRHYHNRNYRRRSEKADNPAVPVTPEEQVESTHEAFKSGASLVHIHVRNPDQSSGSSPELFGRVQEGVRKHCPGMIVQFSAGGRGRDQSLRGAMLH